MTQPPPPPRIRPGLWVKAQLKLCDREARGFAVLSRGDADGGAIILKLVAAAGRADVLSRTTGPDGAPAWYRPLGPEMVPEAEADAYIARQRAFDPDIWALEIMNLDGAYTVDAPVLDQG